MEERREEMTVATEPDMCGVAALAGDVPLLPPLLYDQLMTDMADQFPATPLSGPDLEFDDAPWQQLPTLEDLEELWLVSPAVEIMLHKLALKAHGEGPDLPMFLAQQRQLADFEVDLRKQREALDADAAVDGVDAGAAGVHVAVKSAVDGGGGGIVPGGPEDGDAVVSGGKAARHQNPGRASKVPRGRRAGKAA